MKKRATIGAITQGGRPMVAAWLTQHLQAFVFSLGQMYKNPLGSLLTTAVIGVSLSLPGGLYLLLDNAGRVTANWSGNMQIALFLDPGVDDARLAQLTVELESHQLVREIRLISPDEALDEYRQYSGFSDALAVLENNPLPPVILLNPDADAVAAGRGEELLNDLQALDEVETAQFDRQWANRLFALIGIFQRIIIILSVLLGFAVLLITGNTIRLAIYNRRTEIEINKLFGATNAFIQRPFLYSGLVHGLFGGLMAWLLLLASIALLKGPVLNLAGLYASDFQLFSLSLIEAMALVGIGGLLGLMGSWLAVQRNLKSIGLS